MLYFISSYYERENPDKTLVESFILADNIEELKEIFANLLLNIPFDKLFLILVISELFSEFDYDQINNFENNLYIENRSKKE